MAHKDVEQINILLHILVHLKVDIYLHIDLKSSIAPSDFKYSVCADELYSNPDVLFARKFDMCESDVIDSVKYHLQNVDKKETT